MNLVLVFPFAHTWQFALNKGLQLEDISNVIIKCSGVVGHLNHFTVVKITLKMHSNN